MRLTLYTIIILYCIILISCSEEKKSDQNKNTHEIRDKSVGEDSLDIREDSSLINIEAKDLILPNNRKMLDYELDLDSIMKNNSLPHHKNAVISTTDIKNAIIKKLSLRALELTRRENFQYPDEGENKPAQNGLAFVYGSRDIGQRNIYTATPFDDYFDFEYTICEDSLYGLDCSGYIYRVFNDSHIPLEVGQVKDYTEGVMIQEALNKIFPQYNLIVKNLGEIPLEDFQPGDLIVWNQTLLRVPSHMGIVLKTNSVYVANSAGGVESCGRNKSMDGGPIIRDISYVINSISEFGGYDIIRIMTPNSWEIRLKYTGETDDFLCSEISINPDDRTERRIAINGISHNNSINDLIIHYNYCPHSKLLNLMSEFTNGKRKSTNYISTVLDETNSEYVTMVGQSSIENNPLQIKLTKKKKTFTSVLQLDRVDKVLISLKGKTRSLYRKVKTLFMTE